LFTLIDSFSIVYSFTLISTDNWLLLCTWIHIKQLIDQSDSSKQHFILRIVIISVLQLPAFENAGRAKSFNNLEELQRLLVSQRHLHQNDLLQ